MLQQTAAPPIKIRSQWSNRLPVIVLTLLILGYVGGIMGLHVWRFNRFFYGFDLAFYEQAAWNTAHGRILQVSATDFSNSLLGTDAIFIVLPMSLFYTLIPSPFTLMAFETIMVALGAIPIYWLARDSWGNQRIEDRGWRIGKRVQGSDVSSSPQKGEETRTIPLSDARRSSTKERIASGGSPLTPTLSPRRGEGAISSLSPILYPPSSIARWFGVVMAAVYLFTLSVQNGNLYELRLRPMAAGFLLFAFYYFETRRGWLFILFAVLALMTRPENGLVLVMLGLYGFLTGKHKEALPQTPKGHQEISNSSLRSLRSLRLKNWLWRWRYIIGTVGLGAIWFAVAVLVVIPGSTTTGNIALGVNYPDNSPLKAALNLIVNPGKGWSDLFPTAEVLTGKLLYIPALLLPFLFLPLLSPKVLLMALPPIALNLLSIRPIQWNPYNYHYQTSIVPWLVIAAIYTLAKSTPHRHNKIETSEIEIQRDSPLTLPSPLEGERRKISSKFNPYSLFSIPYSPSSILYPLVLVVTLALYVLGPNPIKESLGRREQARWVAGKALIAKIPADAPLAISNVWASQVPMREKLWLFKERDLYSLHPTRDAQYVFADLRADDGQEAKLVEKTLQDPNWQEIAREGDYILLKRRAP